MAEPKIPQIEEWSTFELLTKEKDVVGIYITGHPLQDYKLELKYFCDINLKVLNENLEFAKNKNFFESYVILSRIKIEMLQRNNLETKCENFHNIELKEITNKYLNTKYRQYLKEDSRIIEVNKEINLAYQKTFLCLPLSMEIAKNLLNSPKNETGGIRFFDQQILQNKRVG